MGGSREGDGVYLYGRGEWDVHYRVGGKVV